MSDKQVQKSGDDSLNIQAKSVSIQTGLTYSDVKEIALDVFKDNFVHLSEVAADTANKRAEEITENFLNELKKQNREALNQAQDPDFQYSLFTVQKEYAKSGDKNLGDLLVDILVERTKVDQKGLLQIVLNESLAVAPKLTTSQLCALSIIFSLKYTRYLRMYSLNILKTYLETRIAPFAKDLPKSQASYQHLVFTGCGSISIGSSSITSILKTHYPGVFTKGFSKEQFDNEIGQIPGSEKVLIPCLRDNSLFQINATDFESLKDIVKKNGILDSEYPKIKSFWNKYLISDEELKMDLINKNKSMAIIYDIWENSPMKSTSLTSVGIAIAHAFTRSKTGDSDDLSIWIN